MIGATQAKPIFYPGHDFVVSDDGKELIIKVSLISMFNETHKKIFGHQGPDQSAIKKYIIHKPYFKKKKKNYFLVTGSDNNVKNAKSAQLWSMVLDTEKLPEELKDYFQSIPNLQTQNYVLAN